MRAVPRDVNASLSKPPQIEEICRASKSLPRSTRISDSNLIRQVLGQKPQTSKFIAKHQLSGDLGMALTVPKKLAKRAVDRNRIKRLIREAFRHSPQNMNEAPELVVFRLRKKVGEKTKGKLRESERQLIQKELKELVR